MRSTRLSHHYLTLLAAISLLGCTKNADVTVFPASDVNYNFYAFGTVSIRKEIATYWKDGEPTTLPSTIDGSAGSGITDMTLSGEKIRRAMY